VFRVSLFSRRPAPENIGPKVPAHREFGPWVPGTSGRDGNGTGGARLKVLTKEVSTMARTDMYLDTMLRHLGAAYYESLHGRATRSDVTRALDTVEEHLNEPASSAAPRSPARPHPAGHPAEHPAHPGHHPQRRRWARRVRDVMTTSVVTVDRITPYQDVARLLTEHRISGLPVLMMGREVAGVISEADLLAAEDKTARQARMEAESRRRFRVRKPRHTSLNAGALMTAPAVTISPDATIPGAARVMNTHHVRRLPVVDPEGKLIGIVSRRDLLSVFLRPDPDITTDARQIIDEIPFADPTKIIVIVRHGVVTLTGTAESPVGRHQDLVALAIQMIWDVDGVVDVRNRINEVKATPEPSHS
jgi:CBS domain-containing protein